MAQHLLSTHRKRGPCLVLSPGWACPSGRCNPCPVGEAGLEAEPGPEGKQLDWRSIQLADPTSRKSRPTEVP